MTEAHVKRTREAAAAGDVEALRALLQMTASDVDMQDENGNTALHLACGNDEEDALRVLVEAGASLDVRTQDGSTPLHVAAANNAVKALAYLVNNGADIHAVNENKQTPMYRAATTGKANAVKYLLDAGSDIHAVEIDGWVPVHGGARSGDVNTIEVLLEHGADLKSVTNDGSTVLHIAAAMNAVKALTYLIGKGVDIHALNKKKQTAMFRAAIRGRANAVKYLLNAGSDLHAVDIDGWTPIHGAARSGDVNTIKVLLEHGADPKSVTNAGSTLLHVAAEYNAVKALTYLVDNGADIHAINKNKQTPMYRAATTGKANAVKCLLAAGSDIHAVEIDGWVPIHGGARSDSVETIKILLEHGADLNSLTHDGKTVLHVAAGMNAVKALTYFVGKGLDIHTVDKTKRTPMFRAAINGSADAVKYLLDAGSDVQAIEIDGWTPLHGAARSGDVDTIKVLVEHGADLSSVTNDGSTVLHVAAVTNEVKALAFLVGKGVDIHAVNKNMQTAMYRASTMGKADAVKYLLDAGSDLHAVEIDGWVPLHGAARLGVASTVKVLLEHGADVTSVNHDGDTPLHIAAPRGRAEATKLLVLAGADANARNKEGKSALYLAASERRLNVVEVLLLAGVDVTAVDEIEGFSPLHVAAFAGSVAILKCLLEHNADIQASAHDGSTALHRAATGGKPAAAQYLLQQGADVAAIDKRGRTALHNASESKGSGCVQLFLNEGAKRLLDLPDKNGLRAIHIAAGSLCPEESKVLLENGADVHALTRGGESPLQLAVFASPSSSASSTVAVLCSYGAEWTTSCQERFAAIPSEQLDEENDETSDHLEWCAGMRAYALHCEKQHYEGIAEPTIVPMEVIQRGEASVKTYIADALSSGASDLTYRCKVCVVGPSEWGKSSLVRSIEAMKPFLMHIRDRTVGIELVSSTIAEAAVGIVDNKPADDGVDASGSQDESSTAKPKSSRRHEITFWDFAGQDVYQVAHALFFSRRTLYVLVVDIKAYSRKLDEVETLRSAALEAEMDRFLSRHVFRWVRMIFARQPDAEFLVLGTKADLLENEEIECARVWSDLQARIFQWKLNYTRELEKEYKNASRGSIGIRELTKKLTKLASGHWLVVSVTRRDSIQAVRQALQQTIEINERGFPMWNKYSRVREAVAAKRAAANRPGDGQHRIENGMMLFRTLCRHLMDEVEDLEYDECHDIVRTLHDLGDVIWYEHEKAGQLQDFIILDPMLVIDIVREVISHEYTKKSGVVADDQAENNEKLRLDGRVSHKLLETFPLWKNMDKELTYAFKMLLKHFQLVYPADGAEMEPESDLIVPSYWKVQLEAASSTAKSTSSKLLVQKPSDMDAISSTKHFCWEYEVSADLADAIFEQFAVQSYTSFMNRSVRGNCIESTCAEFQSWITLHPGYTKHDVIRVEVASEDADIAWLNMRYYLMKLEKVLDGYSGLAVPRYVVVKDERHSLSPAVKAIRDTIMLGRDVDALRVDMPWLPPDLDWFIGRAWQDITAFKELQMMHLVRDKLAVLQKLVVKGDSQRRYPALWSLEYVADRRVAVLRMLSDLSGRCYHVPIEIEVPPAFLAKHGSKIQNGISLVANVLPDSLSFPVLQTAIEGAKSFLEGKSEQATQVINLIEGLDMTTASNSAFTTSGRQGLSPNGAIAVLRDLLKLHNDSLDELSITEICNLECAVTTKGNYVWAHTHEISMLKNEITPCLPQRITDPAEDTSTSLKASSTGDSPTSSRSSATTSSKLRFSLYIETVTSLPDWDWYKTYCKWELLYGDAKTPIASGATTHNADSTVQPSWKSLEMPLDDVGSLEMLQECQLVVQVKRHSRIGWTKLIGEGQVSLRTLVPDSIKSSTFSDSLLVPVNQSSSLSSTRVVHCQIVATN